MNKVIEKSRLTGAVNAICSKSYAHRMLICAFLTGKKTQLNNVTLSQDILATVNVLKAFGGVFNVLDNAIVFEKRESVNGEVIADCFESGSTLRFTLPLCGALGINARFTGSERLLERPNDALLTTLNEHGVKVNGFKLRGQLTAGTFNIISSVSSQYISGLLMALPLLQEDSELCLEGDIVSSNYIDITLEVLKTAGIRIEKTSERKYFIRGGQSYNMPSEITVPGDWSNSAFFLTAGAISINGITVKGLKKDCQGDAKIIEILKQYGASVQINGENVRVKKDNNKAVKIDLTDAPDLAPIVSVLCATADGVSVIYGVDRLKIKESDRLLAIQKMLNTAGIKNEYKDNALYIRGASLNGGVFDGENDHRMVMSEAVLCSMTGGEIVGAQAVNKSYPNFFEHFINLGGKIV